MNMDKIKEESGLLFLGPAALLCATALSPVALLMALPGFALSSYYRMRGFAYSLVLLGLAAFCNHGFLTPDHFWQFGIEVSLACSFWITALAQEERAHANHSFHSQFEASVSTTRYLEEELNKCQEEKTTTQMAADVKLNSLQNKLEEVEKDHSSILILNEVLRKTTACHIEEKNELEKGSIELQRKIGLMREEIDRYEKKRPDRDILMKELNAARIEREQTHLINETLAKLHAQKCQELEQLKAAPSVEEPLGPSLFELQFHQLRKQFDEKNKVLHATRQELFYKDTELEAIKIERQHADLSVDSLVEPMQREVEELVVETSSLKEENSQLQDLIAVLFGQVSKSAARKKKVKTLVPTEAMLF